MSPETILMTGSTGFLGGCLLRRLVRDGHQVVILRRTRSDLTRIQSELPRITAYDLETEELDTIFSRHRFTTVLHCATNYGRKEVDPIGIIEANLILPLHLLKRAAAQGVRTFINTDTLLDKRVSHYSLSKKQFLEWMTTYSSQLSCVNVALEHFFGPDDDPSKFVSFVIGEMLSDKPALDLTPGEQKRDFIYIDDVVDAFATILDHGSDFKPGLLKFEVGSAHTIRIRDFVEQTKRLAQNERTELRFGALPYRANEVMESKVDISALSRLGWTPRVSLEEGLRRTIEFERRKKGSS